MADKNAHSAQSNESKAEPATSNPPSRDEGGVGVRTSSGFFDDPKEISDQQKERMRKKLQE